MKKADENLRILLLLKILSDYSDELHPLSTKDILEMMNREYGVSIHRTTVANNIKTLLAAGFDVIVDKKRENRYFLEERDFELPEIKLLIDAVLSSKIIPENKSEKLINKLMKLTSSSNYVQLKSNMVVSGRVKSRNGKIYYIIDVINTAINRKKRIGFYYVEYDANKQEVLRNSGREYIVTPYSMVWNGDYYYLVGYNHEKEKVQHYRIDRIHERPEILDDDINPIPADFDVTRYSREVFQMYEDDSEIEVTLRGEVSIMKNMIDKFGFDFSSKEDGKDFFIAKVKVSPSPTFYGWLFQWGKSVQVMEPQRVIDGYKLMVNEMSNFYR